MVFKFGCTLVLEQSFYSMYGLTGRKRASCLPPEELGRRPESVGIAIPNTEVWVVDEQGRQAGGSWRGRRINRARLPRNGGAFAGRGVLPAQAALPDPHQPRFLPFDSLTATSTRGGRAGSFDSLRAVSGHSDPSPLPYVEDLLSPGQIRASGCFDQVAIFRLFSKCRQGARLGENDSMALAGILSL